MKRVFIFLLLAGFIAACSGAREKAQPKLPTENLIITALNGSEVIVKTELARSESEKTAGLMFRKNLSDGEGMLFLWDADKILSFWMKNTIIPLSIAYIDREGVISEIYDMQPGQLNSVQSLRSLRYALEVPQGWFSRAGIEIGSKIDLTGVINR